MNALPAAVPVDVAVDDRQHLAVDHAHLVTLLAASLVDQQAATPAEVGLAFVDVDEMTELNRTHMGGDGPTDVLAFPIDGLAQAPAGQPAMLGDIVICPHIADKAPQPLADELALLVVHGALHLLGHDHAEPDEAAVMTAIQTDLLARLHALAS